MQVYLDRPQPVPNKKSSVQKKPFFELQTPDFAWKFVWTVEPNDKVQKYKKYKSTKIQKYKVQNKKVQKYKNAKNAKNVKNTKSTKYKNKKNT